MRKETKKCHKPRRPSLCASHCLLEFWPYWNMAGAGVRDQFLYEEDTYVSTEFNLYNTKDEKLLWSGETDTVYTKDFGKLARSTLSARQAARKTR